MTLPASGTISFSQIIQIIKGNSSTQLNIDDGDTRYLAGSSTSGTTISLSTFYSKPVAGGFTVSSPTYVANTDYTFLCPAYETLISTINGAGGAGGGGDNYTGPPFNIGNAGSPGGPGSNSVFSFVGFSATANGGQGGPGSAGNSAQATTPHGNGSGISTGNFGTVTVGGGALFHNGVAPQQGSLWGQGGGDGGKVVCTFTHNSTTYSPKYKETLSLRIGSGGLAGAQGQSSPAGPGANGSVVVTYS